jgi:predicted secreted protein
MGGGTVGDLGTVVAHLLKRGVRLIQVPTTLLAAVDSSLGGKGALHVESHGTALKNAVGVFHYAEECWICPELFATLSARQRREGAVEGWKMAVCLDTRRWRRWTRRRPSLRELIRESRAMKAAVCSEDPYERVGRRSLLNFGHTFGHVLESLSHFRLSHGDAVGPGILCALDVGRAVGATPDAVASDVERAFLEEVGTFGRGRLAALLAGCGSAQATYGKDDTSISAKAGDTFTIKLEENPTTGYQWSYAISDESIVALDKDEYVADDKSGELMGSGGTRVLTFKALAAGSATTASRGRRERRGPPA